MVPIYICEDQGETRSFLEKLIKNLVMIYDYDMKIVLSTADPEDILLHRQGQKLRSIYFFDVDLNNPNYNGFTLAKKIRSLDPRGFLIFISTHEELIFETFKYRLEAMNYLFKDSPEKLQEQLSHCLVDIQQLLTQETGDQESYFTVKAETNYQIPISDILYFETATAHRVVLISQQRRIEFRGNLKTIAQQVGDGFLKTHRSYLVQACKISEIDYPQNNLIMSNGVVCPMSRQGKRLLKEYFDTQEVGNFDL